MPEITSAQINQLQKSFGLTLLNGGFNLLRKAYKVSDAKKVEFGGIKDIIAKTLGNIAVPVKDLSFYLASWSVWKDFLDSILVPKIDYYAERFDCDNYAFLASSLASLFLCLNSCGVLHCTVYDNLTNKLIAGHYCNLIVTRDEELYLFDMNNGGYTKIEKNQDPVIKNWQYRNLDKVELF